MKVLFLISGGDTGGAKTHVFALLQKLRHKCDIRLICFMDGDFYRELLDMEIDAKLLPQKSRLDMSVLGALKADIEKEKYDLIHCHGARANFIAARLKKAVKLPVVTTMHSDYLLDFDGIYKKLIYTTLNRLALSKMDYYIAVSSNFKRMLVSRNFEPNRIFTVYNGMDYDAPFSFDEKEDFLRRINCPAGEDDVLIGIIGRHDFVKGHDIFVRGCIETAKKYDNVKFLIAGTGDGEQELLDMAKEAGFEDRFYFCGFVKDIYSFINAIDINVISSRSESFPYIMLEGARMKKATVSSRVGGIPDLIKDGETGLLFENKNYLQLAERLSELIENPALREKLGSALYETATTSFSSENLAKKHIEIYESILKYEKDSKKTEVALLGYYGFDNLGDDALLYTILRDLFSLKPDIRALVLTNKPKQGREICLTDTAYRFNPFTLRRVLKNNKMLLFGGGSLIQDATSAKSLFYYLYVLKLAKKYGNIIYIFANGLGPVSGKNIEKAKKELMRADKITLRDNESAKVLKEICPGKSFEVTADPAIGLRGNFAEFERLKKEFSMPSDVPLIGVSIREWKSSDKAFEEKLILLLQKIHDDFSVCPVFIPMKYPTDIAISERIKKGLDFGIIIDRKTEISEAVSLVSGMDIILGMRLHTLVFAAGNAVPCIGITYDPKVTGFMHYIGQDRVLSACGFDIQRAYEYVGEIIKNKDDIKKSLSEKAGGLRALAAKNSEIAIDLLEEK